MHGDHFANTDTRSRLCRAPHHSVDHLLRHCRAIEPKAIRLTWGVGKDAAHLFQSDLCSECTRGTSPGALRGSCAACSCDCSGCTYRAFLLQAGVSVIHQRTRRQHLTGTFSEVVSWISEDVQVKHVNSKTCCMCHSETAWRGVTGKTMEHMVTKEWKASYRAKRSARFSSVRLFWYQNECACAHLRHPVDGRHSCTWGIWKASPRCAVWCGEAGFPSGWRTLHTECSGMASLLRRGKKTKNI